MNSLLLYLFGVLAFIADGLVAHEAIINGNKTEIKPFRYMVSLLGINHNHICGGAIIGKQTVLSAAHCFVNSDNTFKNEHIFALSGTNDLITITLPAPVIQVVKIYIPRDYNASDHSTTGDIAVLKLSHPLPIAYANNLKTVKLERRCTESYADKKATIAGWGANKIDHLDVGRRTDSQLRFAMADIYSHHKCQWEHPTLTITDRHLCAKVEQREHEKHGVCYGDDGGPLVHDGFVIGVLSKYLRSCSERTSAAIYTRVSFYLTFIANAKADLITKNMLAHEFES